MSGPYVGGARLRLRFPSVQWEYMTVVELVNAQTHLDLQLNALGSLGWEAVGLAASDPTLGLNQIHVLLKRIAPDWPAPAGVRAGDAVWVADPTRRFAQRYWDGWRWTEHVIDEAGQRSSDYPNVRR